MKNFLLIVLSIYLFISCEESTSNEKPNLAPIFTSNPDTIVKAGFEYSYTVLVEDPEEDSIEISFDGAVSWLSLNGNVLSGTPSETEDVVVNLTAMDEENVSTQHYSLHVVDNLPPTITNLDDLYEVNINQTKEVTYSIIDPEGENVMIEIKNKPSFVTFDIASSKITIQATEVDLGMHVLDFKYSDGYHELEVSFDIHVYDTWEKVFKNEITSFGLRAGLQNQNQDFTISSAVNENDFRVLRLNRNADVLWDITLETGSSLSIATFIAENSMGDLFIASNSRLYLIYENGQIKNNIIVTDTSDNSTYLYSLTATPDDGVLVLYEYTFDRKRYSIIKKYNSDLEYEWDKEFFVNENGNIGTKLTTIFYSSSNYYATGTTYNGLDREFNLIKMSLNGEIIDETSSTTLNEETSRPSKVRLNELRNEYMVTYVGGTNSHIEKVFDLNTGGLIREYSDAQIRNVSTIDNVDYYVYTIDDKLYFGRKDLLDNQIITNYIKDKPFGWFPSIVISKADESHLFQIITVYNNNNQKELILRKSLYDGRVID